MRYLSICWPKWASGHDLCSPSPCSPLKSWHLMHLQLFKCCEVTLWCYYVVMLYILTILLVSMGRWEWQRVSFDLSCTIFQTPAGWSRICSMYCTLPKVLAQVHWVQDWIWHMEIWVGVWSEAHLGLTLQSSQKITRRGGVLKMHMAQSSSELVDTT